MNGTSDRRANDGAARSTKEMPMLDQTQDMTTQRSKLHARYDNFINGNGRRR